MKSHILKSNLMLLSTSIIWGFAFVAQRLGAEHMGPFAFNGIRFSLGSLCLIPAMVFMKKSSRGTGEREGYSKKRTIFAGFTAGFILFMGATLQQLGMTETTAGKAAFITGLYIVLVPIIGIFLKQYIGASGWLGVILAVIGLYFLCITEEFTISRGDLYQLVGAFFWAMHILAIDRFTKKVDALKLCFYQFVTCSVLSLGVSLLFENTTMDSIYQTAIPILYGGVFSVGIAYTLQVLGQKHAHPAHAAVIMSMETVFASLGGFVVLQENLGIRGYVGCGFMLIGMLLSQLKNFSKVRRPVYEKSLSH